METPENPNFRKKGSTAEKPLRRAALNLKPIAEGRRLIAELEGKSADLHPLFSHSRGLLRLRGFFRTRVGGGDGGAEAFDADVGVDLGGGEVFVAEELLDRLEVRAAVEQMGRKAVAKAVG